MPNQSDITAIITLTNEQIELLISLAIVYRNNDKYYHLPQWFKDLGKGEFEILTFEQLPDYVKEYLKGVAVKEAESFLDDCEQLTANGEVYSESGFYSKDAYKAIEIAIGFI